jgi:protein tyrosine phosphatase
MRTFVKFALVHRDAVPKLESQLVYGLWLLFLAFEQITQHLQLVIEPLVAGNDSFIGAIFSQAAKGIAHTFEGKPSVDVCLSIAQAAPKMRVSFPVCSIAHEPSEYLRSVPVSSLREVDLCSAAVHPLEYDSKASTWYFVDDGPRGVAVGRTGQIISAYVDGRNSDKVNIEKYYGPHLNLRNEMSAVITAGEWEVVGTGTAIPILSRNFEPEIMGDEFQYSVEEVDIMRQHNRITWCSVALAGVNARKNRSEWAIPYDDTRFVLFTRPMDNNDYINASFVHGTRGIATQYPKALDDFWEMVWLSNATDIVALAPPSESHLADNVCEQYWPTNTDETKQYGRISIKCTNGKAHLTRALVSDDDVFKHTDLILHATADPNKSDRPHTVTHHFIRDWPDTLIPLGGDSFSVSLLVEDLVRRREEDPRRPPVVIVHCMYGIGRTGTFFAALIAAEQALELARITHSIDSVYVNLGDIVIGLRKRRMGMVNNKLQYVFACKVAREAVLRILK